MWNPYTLIFCAFYLWGLKRHGEEDGPQYNAAIGLSFILFINLISITHILQRLGIHDWDIASTPDWLFPIILGFIGVLHYIWILRGRRYLAKVRSFQASSALENRAMAAAMVYGAISLALLVFAWSV